MRQTVIAAGVWIAVIVALFCPTSMVAHAPQKAEAAANSSPIDIMQMMRDSKALQVEQFDAI